MRWTVVAFSVSSKTLYAGECYKAGAVFKTNERVDNFQVYEKVPLTAFQICTTRKPGIRPKSRRLLVATA